MINKSKINYKGSEITSRFGDLLFSPHPSYPRGRGDRVRSSVNECNLGEGGSIEVLLMLMIFGLIILFIPLFQALITRD